MGNIWKVPGNEQRLLRLVTKTNMSASQIAREFGVSRNSIIAKCLRKGWALPNGSAPKVNPHVCEKVTPRIQLEDRLDVKNLPPIPKDTRDLTARICGDPLVGRRAIDSHEGFSK